MSIWQSNLLHNSPRAGMSRTFSDLFNIDERVRYRYIIGASFLSLIILSFFLLWCLASSCCIVMKRRRAANPSAEFRQRNINIYETPSSLEVVQCDMSSDNLVSRMNRDETSDRKRKCLFLTFMVSCRFVLAISNFILIRHGLGPINSSLNYVQNGTENGLLLFEESKLFLNQMSANLLDLRQNLHDLNTTFKLCFPDKNGNFLLTNENLQENATQYMQRLYELDATAKNLFYERKESLLSGHNALLDIRSIAHRKEWCWSYWTIVVVSFSITLISVLSICNIGCCRTSSVCLRQYLASVGTPVYICMFSITFVIFLSMTFFAIISADFCVCEKSPEKSLLRIAQSSRHYNSTPFLVQSIDLFANSCEVTSSDISRSYFSDRLNYAIDATEDFVLATDSTIEEDIENWCGLNGTSITTDVLAIQLDILYQISRDESALIKLFDCNGRINEVFRLIFISGICSNGVRGAFWVACGLGTICTFSIISIICTKSYVYLHQNPTRHKPEVRQSASNHDSDSSFSLYDLERSHQSSCECVTTK